MCHGSFSIPVVSLSAYVNNLLIEHDRGCRASRETRERSVCDTFLIAWQPFKKGNPYSPLAARRPQTSRGRAISNFNQTRVMVIQENRWKQL